MKKVFKLSILVLFLLNFVACGNKAPRGSVVAENGQLSVDGIYIVNENGEPVYLKGMSLFWSQWSWQYWNDGVITTLAQEWECTVVRAAMAVEEVGYLTNPEMELEKVHAVVESAIDNGIYIIIDWHDHHALENQAEAEEFFSEMAKIYGNVPNVLFEIYNEPVDDTWEEDKAYAEAIIGKIREQGANNIVLVGSPNWSQDVDLASMNPVEGFDNVAYTFHFYAATPEHKVIMDKVQTAIDNGVAVFATEWGTCYNTGHGAVDLVESQRWIDFMEDNYISWCNWAVNDAFESASALRSGSDWDGNWTDENLTESGTFIKAKIME